MLKQLGNKKVQLSLLINVILYVIVSIISTFHSYELYKIFNSSLTLAAMTAISLEIGQGASLFSLAVLKKHTKGLTWTLFTMLTSLQIIGNLYAGYLTFKVWLEGKSVGTGFFYTIFDIFKNSFNITDNSLILLTLFICVGVIPIIALLFIKSTINYISYEDKPILNNEEEIKIEKPDENLKKPNVLFKKKKNINIADEKPTPKINRFKNLDKKLEATEDIENEENIIVEPVNELILDQEQIKETNSIEEVKQEEIKQENDKKGIKNILKIPPLFSSKKNKVIYGEGDIRYE